MRERMVGKEGGGREGGTFVEECRREAIDPVAHLHGAGVHKVALVRRDYIAVAPFAMSSIHKLCEGLNRPRGHL